jgi:ABC-type sugar transport system ATPase subunit
MIVDVREVTKSFGAKQVLRDITFCVPEGKWLSIVGSSGCGKSTLMQIIAGIADADRGRASVCGSANAEVRRASVGYLLQDFPLYPSLSVHENLRSATKRQYAENGAALDEVIGELQLEPILAQIPSTLSGGEQQRVALGRTLLLHRPVLLLDEPLSNIDVKMRRGVRRFLKQLCQRSGATSILVTHDQEDAISTSDLVGVLHEGQILQFGDPREVFDRPATTFVGDTFGDVQMNWCPPRYLIPNEYGSGADVEPGSEVLGVRESRFSISEQPREGYLKVRIIQREYLGSRTRLFLQHEDWEFSVVVDSRGSFDEAGSIWVRPDLASASRFRGGKRMDYGIS